ncbi:hypothetical protein KDA11_05520 [Candidatus Saccharibacteria bacterium]|nr:hypothetical protein [Candidatus Saccharibacteria bacterium]
MNEQEPNPYNSRTGDKEWVEWRCSQFDEGFPDPTTYLTPNTKPEEIQNPMPIEDSVNIDHSQKNGGNQQ